MRRTPDRRRHPLVTLFGVLLLVCVCRISAATQPSSESNVTREAVRLALDAGAYESAERLASSWCRGVEHQFGLQSLQLARALDLLVEAKIKNGRSAEADTVALAERTVALKEQHLGRRDPDTIGSLHNLGTVRQQRGEFSPALSWHERALEIRLATAEPKSPQVADSLDLVALALIQLHRAKDAERRLAQSTVIRENVTAESHVALARTLELVGLLHRSSGTFSDAIAPLERALTIRRRFSPEHPDSVSLLQTLGDVRFLLRDSKRAHETWSEAIQLARRTLRSEHPVLIELLQRLGLAAFSQGNLADARELRQAAFAVAERSLAPCHPTFTAVLWDIAISRQFEGSYSEAGRLYRRSQTILDKCGATNAAALGTDAKATLTFNQALLAREIGDLDEARRLYSRAAQIWAEALGAHHPFVATGLNSLAEVSIEQKRFVEARRLYEQALGIRAQSLGTKHPDYARTLANLSITHAQLGNLTLADRYMTDALRIYKQQDTSHEREQFAAVLLDHADLATRRMDYESARASLREALTLREGMFGASHPATANIRALLASADFVLGSPERALTEALEAERAGRDHLQFTVRYLPERQAMAYAGKRPKGLDLALSLAAAGVTSDHAAILDALVHSRGVILDELAARSRAAAAANSETEPLLAAAIRARQRFANLMVRSLQNSDAVPRAMLDEARQQKEEAERNLAERSAEASAEITRAQTGFSEVLAALPPGSVLVSFVKYQRTRLPAAGSGRPGTPVPSYGAYVVRAGSTHAEFVSIGAANHVDELVRRWRLEAGGRSIAGGATPEETARAYRTTAVALRRAIWDPLAANVAGTTRTFIVADGALTLVNFAALPDAEGRYLVEGKSVIHYLSTERDLVSPAGATTRNTLLAVGGAAFGGRVSASTVSASLRRAGCQGFGALQFEDLPGSRREASEIVRSWSEHDPGTVTLLSGLAATETAVKRDLGGHRVVHLATHGFFLGADCTPAVQKTRGVGGLTTQTKRSPTVDNPLLLSGLAFAGANRPRKPGTDEDDGILTAEEIAALNLQGTEWAVLSACDTGLGAIAAGEGVLGLRRAFQVAGARTVIMSLWSVEDRAAMDWMRALYDGRLRRGLDTAAAVRDASLSVLAQRRARRASTHPFYWAGFVASGDWK